MSNDMVNSPEHYNQGAVECIDAIRAALGDEGFVAYCRGNAIKYNWRTGHKSDSVEDLKKAAWYSSMAAGDDPRTTGILPEPTKLTPTEQERAVATLKELKDALGLETAEEVREDLIARGYGSRKLPVCGHSASEGCAECGVPIRQDADELGKPGGVLIVCEHGFIDCKECGM